MSSGTAPSIVPQASPSLPSPLPAQDRLAIDGRRRPDGCQRRTGRIPIAAIPRAIHMSKDPTKPNNRSTNEHKNDGPKLGTPRLARSTGITCQAGQSRPLALPWGGYSPNGIQIVCTSVAASSHGVGVPRRPVSPLPVVDPGARQRARRLALDHARDIGRRERPARAHFPMPRQMRRKLGMVASQDVDDAPPERPTCPRTW